MKNKAESFGFTLIELIVVIAILGILAAIALPRFLNASSNARTSVVQGMQGAIMSAVAIARSQYVLTGNTTAVTVTVDGQAIACAAGTGIPTAAGIVNALQTTQGFNIVTAGTTTTFTPTSFTGTGTCNVQYNGITGIATATTTNC